MTRYDSAGLELSSWIKTLKAFEEAEVVKMKKNGKLGDRGAPCILSTEMTTTAATVF